MGDLERITARRSELDTLAEELAKHARAWGGSADHAKLIASRASDPSQTREVTSSTTWSPTPSISAAPPP